MTKTRKSRTGKTIKELSKPVVLTVNTKCPEKYILIDMETGQFYAGTENDNWRELKG